MEKLIPISEMRCMARKYASMKKTCMIDLNGRKEGHCFNEIGPKDTKMHIEVIV